jgi:hypothetical protein
MACMRIALGRTKVRYEPWPASPHQTARQILQDLVRTTPGDEGKWFAAAKEEGLYDEALALASASACDPRTLTRAARELVQAQPDFAIGAGLLALHWLTHGYGYEVTGADVWEALFEHDRRRAGTGKRCPGSRAGPAGRRGGGSRRVG